MRELVLHVPVNVDASPPPTRQWLLQPVPHGLRIEGLALFGHSAAYPAAAVPQDLLLMQSSQLEDIQHLELHGAQRPDLPPMPKLSELRLSFVQDTALQVLPNPTLMMLEVLKLHNVSSCPSLGCLSRLTRLSLTGGPPGPVSIGIWQSFKVCNACSLMFVCTDAIA